MLIVAMDMIQLALVVQIGNGIRELSLMLITEQTSSNWLGQYAQTAKVRILVMF